MSPAGCSHVNGYKVDNWKQNLRVIYQCFVWSGTAETRRRKVKTPNYSVTFRKQKFCDFDVKRERTQKWRASDVPHDVQILDAFEHIHKLFLQ